MYDHQNGYNPEESGQNQFRPESSYHSGPIQNTFETSNYHVEDSMPRKQKKGMTGGRIVALCLCCSLLGGAIGAGGVAGINMMTSGGATGTKDIVNMVEGARQQAVINLSSVDTSKEMTPAEVYAANVNSTVGITTSIVSTNWWGIPVEGAAAGSGFIISDDGYIVTNYHVIEGASGAKVTLYDGSTYDASLVGYDQSNDLAVLKIDATGLTPVVLGDSDSLSVGDQVVAIGNPLGELTFSLTQGYVSALDREVTLSSGSSSNGTRETFTMELIQTDCAINSGNSGGALFNMYGEVVGITNAKYSSSSSSEASIDNIGFAIPISDVRSIIDSIIEKGYISKPYMGVTVTDVTEDIHGLYNMPYGAVMREITEGGPAQKAGLQVGDIITGLNDTEITDGDSLVDAVGSCQPGDTVTLTVYRSGETIQLEATVGEQQKPANAQASSAAPQNSGSYGWSNGNGFIY